MLEHQPGERLDGILLSQTTLTPSFGASFRSAFTDGVRVPASILLM